METAKIRDGAYGNFVTGMGRRDTDKTENTFVNPYAGTDIVELARIKVQDGIAARIVECVPETAFKEPVTITGDSSGKVFKEASAVGLFEALQLAGEYQRLTGGALIVSEYENEYDIINDVVDFNPTAENMAKWICDQVPFCHKVVIQESEGNLAQYDKDEED